jgi:hypothetical protein
MITNKTDQAQPLLLPINRKGLTQVSPFHHNSFMSLFLQYHNTVHNNSAAAIGNYVINFLGAACFFCF